MFPKEEDGSKVLKERHQDYSVTVTGEERDGELVDSPDFQDAIVFAYRGQALVSWDYSQGEVLCLLLPPKHGWDPGKQQSRRERGRRRWG